MAVAPSDTGSGNYGSFPENEDNGGGYSALLSPPAQPQHFSRHHEELMSPESRRRCLRRKRIEKVVFTALLICLVVGAVTMYVVTLATKEAGPTRVGSFAFIGDWSKRDSNGSDASQRAVAQVLLASAATKEYFAVLTSGDNFYEDGIGSTNSSRWTEEWSDVYCRGGLADVPWVASLGNHDYRGNITVQILKSKEHRNWILPSRYYQVIMPLSPSRDGAELPSLLIPGGLPPTVTAEVKRGWAIHDENDLGDTAGLLRGASHPCVAFTVIDTNPLDPAYTNNSEYDKEHPMMKENLKYANATAQLEWIDSALQGARARCHLSILLGHSPPYSGGSHGNNTYLIQHLTPMLKEHQVHAAVFGHDHVLEHIEYQGVDYFVSGGGSLEENGLHHLPNITRYGEVKKGFLDLDVLVEDSQYALEFKFLGPGSEAGVYYSFTKHVAGD